ncbi:MAG: type VI secretion system baseplate subunit TssG [Sandaracinus sp.]
MTRDLFSRIAATERRTGRAVGRGALRDEPLRFVPDPELCFEASEVSPRQGEVWVTRALSLTGASGALPTHLAEEIALEDPEHGVRQSLLAPFHHRMLSLAHRSVQRTRFPDAAIDEGSGWRDEVAALVSAAGESAVDRHTALWLAPLLHGRPSAAALARALTLVSQRWLGGVRIALRERQGERIPIAPAARSRLGRARLGDDALLGSSVADPAGHATIEIEPVAATHRAALAEGGPAREAIRMLVARMGDATGTLSVRVRREEGAARLGLARLGASTLGARRGAGRSENVRIDATAG